MKKKIIKLWGVGMIVVLMASLLLVGATPASAGTQAFTPAGGPNPGIPVASNQILASNVAIIEVASNGDLFAVDSQTLPNTIYKSVDGGLTWTALEDLGTAEQEGYGQHYPRVTRLNDGRLMMTFTKRGVNEPLGLRAIFSDDDGQTWNFDSDHIIIDENTPSGMASGGGFGNTIQLSDGSLVSCYSYRDSSGNIQMEVVRWRLDPR